MKNISVIVPVYNEEERLKIVLEALLKSWPKKYSLQEVIFVDDGSTDKTRKILAAKHNTLSKKLNVPVEVLGYNENRGKGYAVKIGLAAAEGEWALLIDVDMSTPFSELAKFETASKKSDVVVGTRKNGHSTVVVAQPLYRQVLGKAFTYLTQFILGVKVSDFTCGFKLIKKDVYQDIADKMRIARWGYDAEILYLASKDNYQIAEIPVKWYNDARTKVNLVKDIARSLTDLLQIRWSDVAGRYDSETTRGNLKRRVVLWSNEA